VKAPDAERASKHEDTQAAATARAREITRDTGGKTVVHGRDGTIRQKDSTGGRDPYPPKG